jgi:hypothetical protein
MPPVVAVEHSQQRLLAVAVAVAVAVVAVVAVASSALSRPRSGGRRPSWPGPQTATK